VREGEGDRSGERRPCPRVGKEKEEERKRRTVRETVEEEKGGLALLGGLDV
jgi:hypothetical protein